MRSKDTRNAQAGYNAYDDQYEDNSGEDRFDNGLDPNNPLPWIKAKTQKGYSLTTIANALVINGVCDTIENARSGLKSLINSGEITYSVRSKDTRNAQAAQPGQMMTFDNKAQKVTGVAPGAPGKLPQYSLTNPADGTVTTIAEDELLSGQKKAPAGQPTSPQPTQPGATTNTITAQCNETMTCLNCGANFDQAEAQENPLWDPERPDCPRCASYDVKVDSASVDSMQGSIGDSDSSYSEGDQNDTTVLANQRTGQLDMLMPLLQMLMSNQKPSHGQGICPGCIKIVEIKDNGCPMCGSKIPEEDMIEDEHGAKESPKKEHEEHESDEDESLEHLFSSPEKDTFDSKDEKKNDKKKDEEDGEDKDVDDDEDISDLFSGPGEEKDEDDKDESKPKGKDKKDDKKSDKKDKKDDKKSDKKDDKKSKDDDIDEEEVSGLFSGPGEDDDKE